MKAFEATFTKNGSNPEVILIGANSMSAAAKKAEGEEEVDAKELVKLELTEKVIL